MTHKTRKRDTSTNQNCDTKQAIEQQKRTQIKRKENKLSPQNTQVNSALKRAQGVTTKHA